MEITHSKTMRIPLTQGKFAIVDAEDYEYLNQWKWCYYNGYAIRNSSGPRRVSIYMHRVVLERMCFTDLVECDHVNRDGIDNRKYNLRSVTHQQNCYNRGKRNNNTSGYVGVYWMKNKRKWRARITVNGRRRHLGYFVDKKEAARVYNLAARMYHGEFSVLNRI